MSKRLLAGAAALAVMVLAIGVVASVARADTRTEAVGEAGTVTFSIEGGVIAFVKADPSEGWTFGVDRQDGSHLKVTFRNEAGGEVEFEAELEDGALTVEAGAATSTSAPTSSTTSTTIGGASSSTTSTTVASTSTSTTLGGGSTTTVPDDDDDDGDDVALPVPMTIAAGAAGSVDILVIGDEVVFAGASVNDGWSFDVHHVGGSHVEVDFTHADGTEIEFRVDADLRVRIEIEG
jgi:hypothetical protein